MPVNLFHANYSDLLRLAKWLKVPVEDGDPFYLIVCRVKDKTDALKEIERIHGRDLQTNR
jgi:hypothetical protein